MSRGFSLSSRWCYSGSFWFSLTCTTGTLGSLWVSYSSSVENTPYSPKSWVSFFMSRLPWSQGTKPVVGWQLMGPLACVFPVLLSYSQKPPPRPHCLRCCNCLTSSPAIGRGGMDGEADSAICGFVPFTGFNHTEYRPLRLECCLCSFAICQGRSVAGSGRMGWGVNFCISGFVFLVMECVPPLPSFATLLH